MRLRLRNVRLPLTGASRAPSAAWAPSVTELGSLRSARDRFVELLAKPNSLEREWQKLFAECPYILTQGLSLGIEPEKLIPCTPGREEADFYYFPDSDDPYSAYGVIEIKRPCTKVLKRPRKNLLCLSSDAATAVAQAKKYGRELGAIVERPLARTLFFGNAALMFVIAGLESECAKIVRGQILQNQLQGTLGDVRLATFDRLFEVFSAKIPPRLFLLVPSAPAPGGGLAPREAPRQGNASAESKAARGGGGRGGFSGQGRGAFAGGGRGGFGSGPGSASFNRPRELHPGSCSECGADVLVPFLPRAGLPLFCRDCFAKHRPPRNDRF